MATKVHENNGCAVYTSVTATSAAGAAGSDVIPCAGYRAGCVTCTTTSVMTTLNFYSVAESSTGTKVLARTSTGGGLSVAAPTSVSASVVNLPDEVKGWQYFCMQAAGAGNTALTVVLRS